MDYATSRGERTAIDPHLIKILKRRKPTDPASDIVDLSKREQSQIPSPTPTTISPSITQHTALTPIEEDEKLIINLDFVSEECTDMITLNEIISEYAPIVTDITIMIQAPVPHSIPRKINNERTDLVKQMFEELNKFEISRLEVILQLNYLNFPQMKLAAGLFALRFGWWKLGWTIDGFEEKAQEIPKGCKTYRRLRGVWNSEFNRDKASED